MIPRAGLSRQILIAMSAITVTAGLLVFFGTYLAYTAIVAFYPMPESESSLNIGDFLIVGVLIAVTLPIAALISFRLARRILEPLESLAANARRITAGDLTARARVGDRALGETAALIDDFNTMAQRLQDMAADMALWNATIAHELRTPLTILKGRLQGMIDGVFEPDEGSLHALILQVDGLARLVEDLRTVTLADSGHLDLRVKPVRLAPEIEQMAELMAHDLRASGFRIELDLADVVVDADATRIRQALLALVTNAQRYSVRGTITISLAEGDGEILLGVADEGPGLSPGMATRVFDPFVRGEPARSSDMSGNGLGLSVVRAIVEAHGGRLRYRGAPGGGAMFEMIFAKAKRHPAAQDA
ncbi:ATP-binding protein [Kaistia dalseonensis]|uniref:histidine kinase n=1 Tax=Kaistia dalseonensis TaxID=410840 RepID=A0ABU0H9N4_9HYPH|nr:ATP-binding protein [Kaistia dalseonensis]MCX5496369.1 ATP-binding protein [Kaistia dalseonensis]MDQ0438990.1 two-component system sensor histidine kinase AdeS [Kaistia dalseonensis]